MSKNSMAKKQRNYDIAEQKFGKLTAIRMVYQTNNTKTLWECECECGNKKIKTYWGLVRGRVRSCGCLRSPSNKANPGWTGYGDISGATWCSIRRDASRSRKEIDIDLEYIWGLYEKQNKRCAITGVSIGFTEGSRQQKNKFIRTASLDRIDSNKG